MLCGCVGVCSALYVSGVGVVVYIVCEAEYLGDG